MGPNEIFHTLLLLIHCPYPSPLSLFLPHSSPFFFHIMYIYAPSFFFYFSSRGSSPRPSFIPFHGPSSSFMISIYMHTQTERGKCTCMCAHTLMNMHTHTYMGTYIKTKYLIKHVKENMQYLSF